MDFVNGLVRILLRVGWGPGSVQVTKPFAPSIRKSNKQKID